MSAPSPPLTVSHGIGKLSRKKVKKVKKISRLTLRCAGRLQCKQYRHSQTGAKAHRGKARVIDAVKV